MAKPILRVGQTFQTNVGMSHSPGVFAWQVNLTFSPSMVQVSAVSWGPDWSPPSGLFVHFLVVNDAGGSLLVSASLFLADDSSLIQGSDVLFTITWNVMSNKAGTSLHIVTPLENPDFHTVFLAPDLLNGLAVVPYSPIDGSFCNWNTRQTC